MGRRAVGQPSGEGSSRHLYLRPTPEPAIPEAEISADNIPTTALYRLYDAAGALLYVGIADDLRARFQQHMADKAWWAQVARRTVTWYGTRSKAICAEDIAIKTEGPVHNHAGRPGDRIVITRRRSPVRHPDSEIESCGQAEADETVGTAFAACEEALAAIADLPDPQERIDAAGRLSDLLRADADAAAAMRTQDALAVWDAEGLTLTELAALARVSKGRAEQLVRKRPIGS